MADYDQIMKALRNAHAAGDTAAASRLAQMAKAAQAPAVEQATPAPQAAPRPSVPQAVVQPRQQAIPGDGRSIADVTSGRGMGFQQYQQATGGNQSAAPLPPQGAQPTQLAAAPVPTGDIPEGMFFNPETNQYTSREMLKNNMDRTRLDALTSGAMQGSSAALGDEALSSRLGMAFGLDTSTEEGRNFFREKTRAAIEKDGEENYWTQLTGEALGAIASPGLGAAKFVAGATTKATRIIRTALTGGAAASAYAAGDTEGGLQERSLAAAQMAPIGMLFGAAAPAVASALRGASRSVVSLFAKAQERPTVATLRAAKNAAYKMVDDSNEMFSADDMSGLAQSVRRAFDDGNYVEEVDNASRAALSILDRRAGQPTTLSQLDSIRQNLWKRYAGAKDQPQILDAIKAIDDLVDTRAGSSQIMDIARAANAKYAKSQLIEDAFTRATDQTAATGSGGNILNKYRQAVSSIINNPSKAKFFAPEEIELMRGFVRGTGGENAKRLIGKLSPSGNGLMMALHTIGGVATGGWSVPLMLIGSGAKSSADKGVRRGAEALQDVVSGFRPANTPRPLPSPLGALGASGAAPAISGEQGAIRNTPILRQGIGR